MPLMSYLPKQAAKALKPIWASVIPQIEKLLLWVSAVWLWQSSAN